MSPIALIFSIGFVLFQIAITESKTKIYNDKLTKEVLFQSDECQELPCTISVNQQDLEKKFRFCYGGIVIEKYYKRNAIENISYYCKKPFMALELKRRLKKLNYHVEKEVKIEEYGFFFLERQEQDKKECFVMMQKKRSSACQNVPDILIEGRDCNTYEIVDAVMENDLTNCLESVVSLESSVIMYYELMKEINRCSELCQCKESESEAVSVLFSGDTGQAMNISIYNADESDNKIIACIDLTKISIGKFKKKKKDATMLEDFKVGKKCVQKGNSE